MEEKVKSWRNHDKPVKRIAILTGAGNNTNLIERALEKGCDTYITGEKHYTQCNMRNLKALT